MDVFHKYVSLIAVKLVDNHFVEAISCTGLHDEALRIKGELCKLQCFIKVADAKKQRVELEKNLVQTAYDIEDVIDTFLLKIEHRRRRGLIVSLAPIVIAHCEMALKFKLIELKFKEIKERTSTYDFQDPREGTSSASGSRQERMRTSPIVQETEFVGFHEEFEAQLTDEEETSSASGSLQDWMRTSPIVQETEFVGFHKEFEELVAQLTDKEGTTRLVVSLVGIGGIGKTTLAREVYNSDRVKKYFPVHAWISVTQEYALRDLLRVIIKRWSVLHDTVVEKSSVAELRYFISEYLKDNRYLVVLDDIWQPEAWDALKDAFPADSKNGSRVMLTTRHENIASCANPTSRLYKLQPLNPDDSWRLFCQKTFPEKNGICPSHLQKLGGEIVAECRGLPLAIIAIGGLLSKRRLLSKKKEKEKLEGERVLIYKENEEILEWENVRKNISIRHPHGATSDDVLSLTSNVVLSLSYQDLPNLLKPVFLYLVNFPKDHEFRAKELIQMWAAEGLIQQRWGLTVEEFGKHCLIELIQRSMVQVAKGSSRGSIKSVYIQKKIRDLSISEAKEYGFLEVHSENANAPSTARRLAIHHNDLSEYMSLSRSTPFLRSVFIYTQGRKLLQRKQENFLYRGFKLLRVLCLNGAYIKELPKAIGELFHMRYLGCKGTSLETLPSTIGNLPHLQTLSVSSFHDMKVPGTILEMQELRHLQVEDAVKSTYLGWKESWRVIERHPGLDGESNLQTLTCVEAGEWMVDCLGKLINLRKLGIRLHHDRKYDQVLYKSIPNMKCLQSLSVVTRCPFSLSVPPLLQIPNLSKFRLEGKLGMLPKSTEFPITLTKLTLAFSYLKEDPLPTLAKLENLRVLRLLGASYTGKKMACVANGFRRLESLHLEALDQLEEWSIAKGAMPILSHLRIDDCQHLKMLPEGLQHVTTLKNVELWNMHDEFKARLQGEEVDWHKILHTIDIR